MMNIKPALSRMWHKIMNLETTLFPFLKESLGAITPKEEKLIKILDFAEIENFVFVIKITNPPQNRHQIARAFIAKAVYNMQTTSDLIDRLKADRTLRVICGWREARDVPSESSFSRVFAILANSNAVNEAHSKFITTYLSGTLFFYNSTDSTAIEVNEKPVKLAQEEKEAKPAQEVKETKEEKNETKVAKPKKRRSRKGKEKRKDRQQVLYSSTDSAAIEVNEKQIKSTQETQEEKETQEAQPAQEVKVKETKEENKVVMLKKKRGRKRKEEKKDKQQDEATTDKQATATVLNYEKLINKQITMASTAQMVETIPISSGVGKKVNSKGNSQIWIGGKLHLGVVDGDIPITAIYSSASVHDSQLAIPVINETSKRVTYLYDLCDRAYDSATIRTFSKNCGHTPIIDINQRNSIIAKIAIQEEKTLTKMKFTTQMSNHYNHRSSVERVNSYLKESFGCKHINVKGGLKVATHLMFGVLSLCIHQSLKLLT